MMKIKTKRCIALLLCLTVLVGLIPFAGMLVSNAATDSAVTTLTFSNRNQVYYLMAPYDNVIKQQASTQTYGISFDYYLHYTDDVPDNTPAMLVFCNDNYEVDKTGGVNSWGFIPATKTNDNTGVTVNTGGDLDGDFAFNTTYSSHVGFKKNTAGHVTFNFTLPEGAHMRPMLYAYGACTMYIWNYRFRVHETLWTDLRVPSGDTADLYYQTSNIITASEGTTLSDYNWNDYNQWVDDQAVIEVTFNSADDRFVIMEAHYNVFTGGDRSTWLTESWKDTTNGMLFKITFDYYLESSSSEEVILTETATSYSLAYIGGNQTWANGDWKLYPNQEKSFCQYLRAKPNANDTDSVVAVRPTIRAGVAGAKLYIWNYTISWMADPDTVNVTYTSLELEDDAEYCYRNSDVKFDTTATVKKGLSRSNYKWAANYTDHDVIEAKLKTTTDSTKALDAAHPYGWWMMSADLTKFGYSQSAYNTMVAIANDKLHSEMTLTFDYYVSAPDGTDVIVCREDADGDDTTNDEIISPGGYQDYVRGNKKLFLGEKRNFTMVLQTYRHYECRPYIRSSGPAKVYVWNVRIMCAGRVYDTWSEGGNDGAQNNWVANKSTAADFGTTQVRNVTTLNEFVVYDKLIDELDQPTNTDDTKVFVGWYDDEGDPYYRKDMISEWHVLDEQWYNFYTGGTQIRTNAGTHGLRFRFYVDEKFETNEYITDFVKKVILLPELARNNAELLPNTTYSYNGKTVKSSVGNCPKYYDENRNLYTAVVLNNADKTNLDNVYAARGMLTFTSVNCIPYTVYTHDTNAYTTNADGVGTDANDQATGSMARSYNIVKELVKKGETTSGNTLENPTTTTTTVTTTRATVVSTTLSAAAQSAVDPASTVVGSKDDYNTYVYKTANGISVREAHIQSNRGDGEVTLVQIADTHLSEALNAVDTASPFASLIQKSYAHSQPTWQKTDGTIDARANLTKCMTYASYFDQTVHTGDLLSYLSDANIQMAKKLVWEVDPNAILVTGNHDTARDYQATDYTTTLDARALYLEQGLGFAEGYSDYYSKVVKNKVMVIAFNNNIKPSNATVIKMRRDIDKAREMGYVVLVFCHEPFLTENPDDSNVLELEKEPSTASDRLMNFYKPTNYPTDYFGGTNSTGNEKVVWDLIKENGDVVRGIFGGHWHVTNFSSLPAKTASGADTSIPQYLLRSTPSGGTAGGHVTRIRVF